MAVTIKQKLVVSSEASKSPVQTREYHAWGDSDTDAIENAIANGVGATAGSDVIPTAVTVGGVSLTLTNLSWKSRDDDDEYWDVSAKYSVSSLNTGVAATNDEVISFDVNPQQIHVTQSLGTQSHAEAGKTPTNHHGAIGVEKEKIKGTDIYVPVLSFQITKYEPIENIDNDYVNNLANAAFHLNDAPFRGGGIAEVLYMGASGAKRGDDDYAITHKFLRGADLFNQTIGAITGINIPAWAHTWVEYVETKDGAANAVARRPKHVYVETMYQQADFPALLGLTP